MQGGFRGAQNFSGRTCYIWSHGRRRLNLKVKKYYILSYINKNSVMNIIVYSKQYLLNLITLMNAKSPLFTLNSPKIIPKIM